MNGDTPLSRRDFVRASAATAVAATSASGVLTSAAFGQDKPASSEGGGNKALRVGFIGLGKMGRSHLDKFVGYRDVFVTAVCDVDTARREAARAFVDEKYAEFERKGAAKCKEYKNYREVLADRDVDAVLIATPDHWHTAMAIDACKAKKDVYCEKPLTLTIDEAKRIIEAARKHERVFQVGSQQRTEGPFADAVDMVRAGRIGKVKEVRVGIGPTSKPCQLFPEQPDPGLDWNEWLGPAQERPYHHVVCQRGLPDTYPFNPGWRDYREFSGGNVTDWGAHHIDITHWALDMDQSGPAEARPPKRGMDPYGAELVYRGSQYGTDEVVVRHEEVVYEHDVKGKDGKTEHKTERNGILFIGDAGRLFVNRAFLLSEPDGIAKQSLSEGERKVPRVDGKGMQNHHRNWIECIGSRQRPIADVEVGARTITACHIMNIAIWHDAKLNWDPQKWEFTGEFADAANALRSRPRRKGYELPEV
jgi:predicted dehydrogenase